MADTLSHTARAVLEIVATWIVTQSTFEPSTHKQQADRLVHVIHSWLEHGPDGNTSSEKRPRNTYKLVVTTLGTEFAKKPLPVSLHSCELILHSGADAVVCEALIRAASVRQAVQPPTPQADVVPSTSIEETAVAAPRKLTKSTGLDASELDPLSLRALCRLSVAVCDVVSGGPEGPGLEKSDITQTSEYAPADDRSLPGTTYARHRPDANTLLVLLECFGLTAGLTTPPGHVPQAGHGPGASAGHTHEANRENVAALPHHVARCINTVVYRALTSAHSPEAQSSSEVTASAHTSSPWVTDLEARLRECYGRVPYGNWMQLGVFQGPILSRTPLPESLPGPCMKQLCDCAKVMATYGLCARLGDGAEADGTGTGHSIGLAVAWACFQTVLAFGQWHYVEVLCRQCLPAYLAPAALTVAGDWARARKQAKVAQRLYRIRDEGEKAMRGVASLPAGGPLGPQPGAVMLTQPLVLVLQVLEDMIQAEGTAPRQAVPVRAEVVSGTALAPDLPSHVPQPPAHVRPSMTLSSVPATAITAAQLFTRQAKGGGTGNRYKSVLKGIDTKWEGEDRDGDGMQGPAAGWWGEEAGHRQDAAAGGGQAVSSPFARRGEEHAGDPSTNQDPTTRSVTTAGQAMRPSASDVAALAGHLTRSGTTVAGAHANAAGDAMSHQAEHSDGATDPHANTGQEAVSERLHPLARHSRWTAPFVFPASVQGAFEQSLQAGDVSGATPAVTLRAAIAQGHRPPKPEWTEQYTAHHPDVDWQDRSLSYLLEPVAPPLHVQHHGRGHGHVRMHPHHTSARTYDRTAPWPPSPEEGDDPYECLTGEPAAVARALVFAGTDRRLQASVVRRLIGLGRAELAQLALRTACNRTAGVTVGTAEDALAYMVPSERLDHTTPPGLAIPDQDLAIVVEQGEQNGQSEVHGDARLEQSHPTVLVRWADTQAGPAAAAGEATAARRRLDTAHQAGGLRGSSDVGVAHAAAPGPGSDFGGGLARPHPSQYVRSDGYWAPQCDIVRGVSSTGQAPHALPRPSPDVLVHVVDRLAGLQDMAQHWRGALEGMEGGAENPSTLLVVGVDAEWRPDRLYPGLPPHPPTPTGKGPTSWPVATVQLAMRIPSTSAGHISSPQGELHPGPQYVSWVVDMLGLHQEALYSHGSSSPVHPIQGLRALASALNDSLGWLLRHPRIAKVGFGLSGDLARLAQSLGHFHPECLWPGARGEVPQWCMGTAVCCVDLKTLVPAARGAASAPEAALAAVLSLTDVATARAMDAQPSASPLPAPVPTFVEELASILPSPTSRGKGPGKGVGSPLARTPTTGAPTPVPVRVSLPTTGQPPQSLSHTVELVLGGHGHGPAHVGHSGVPCYGIHKKHQTSDWHARPLSLEQLIYAATDAVAAVAVCEVLEAWVGLDRAGALPGLTLSSLMAVCGEAWTPSQDVVEGWRRRPLGPMGTADEDDSEAVTAADPLTVRRRLWTLEPMALPPTPGTVGTAGGTEHGPVPGVALPTVPTLGSVPRAGKPRHSAGHAASDRSEAVQDTCASESLALPCGPSRVEAALRACGLDPTGRLLHVSSETVVEALMPDGQGSAPGEAPASDGFIPVKSLAIWVGTQPCLAVLASDQRLDTRRITDHCAALATGSGRQIGPVPKSMRRQYGVRLATAAECVAVWGYSPGTFPPIGLMTDGLDREHGPQQATPGPGTVFVDAGLAGGQATISTATLPTPATGAWPSALLSLAHRLGQGREEPILVAGGGSLTHCLALTMPELLTCLGQRAAVLGLVEGQGQGPDDAPVTLSSMTGEDLHEGEDDLNPAHPSGPIPSLLPLPRPCFLLDGMLGRLTRWLRVIGIDAESTAGPGADEYVKRYRRGEQGGAEAGAGAGDAGGASESARARARKSQTGSPLTAQEILQWADTSGRIILTRDRKLLAKRPGQGDAIVASAPVFWVSPNDTHAQFEAVTGHFGISVRPEDLMARCAKCNGLGYARVGPEVALASGDVPPKVCAALQDFWRCFRCGKLYWEGAKFEDTRGKFWALFQEPGHGQGDGQPGHGGSTTAADALAALYPSLKQ